MARLPMMSERQKQMVEMFRAGKSDRAICQALGLTLDQAHAECIAIRAHLGLAEGASIKKAVKGK